MGLVLLAGSPRDTFEPGYAEWVEGLFRGRFGDVYAGDPEREPYESYELSWSWWRELQQLGASTLGKRRVRHLMAVRAWCGVYVPADTEPFAEAPREPLPEPDRSEAPPWEMELGQASEVFGVDFQKGYEKAQADAIRRLPWWKRLQLKAASWVLENWADEEDVASSDPRRALQVASLSCLVAELEALAEAEGLPTEDAALEQFLEQFGDDRCDDDGALQAYAVTMLTAHEALRRGQPLWVVK